MKKLLHTLYIHEPDIVLKKKGRAIHAIYSDGQCDHIPLGMIENIIVFSKIKVEDEVFQLCADNDIDVWFLNGRAGLRYKVSGRIHGNVCVRKAQYLLSESSEKIAVSKNMINAKIRNSRFVLEKFKRNHPEIVSGEFCKAIQNLKECEEKIQFARNDCEIRNIEGYASRMYFQAFPDMILQKDEVFQFVNRNRRPPKDCTNALLSMVYTLLMIECASALECAGVDPYVGFLHTDRSGRASMALDIMEEFRPLIADRFVMRLINLRLVDKYMFEKKDDGIYLTSDGRSTVFREWNHMKQEKVKVENLDETIFKGLFPHIQAQRLVRFLKGETKEYEPMIGR